ncbi:MAG: PadR family transcriptional regulator [Nitrososphaerales archaeon]
MRTRKSDYCCDMRGFFSFMVLWLLTKKSMYGSEIAEELKALRGDRPNPGTLYPALKELEKKKLVTSEREGNLRVYRITEKGRAGFEVVHDYFCRCFDDLFYEWEKKHTHKTTGSIR